MDGEKMSKSLGNVYTVRDLLGSYRGEVLRFALLSAHYRSPLNFSAELLEQAQTTLDSLYGTLREVQDIEIDMEVALADEPFYQALNDDLNTPLAIAGIHALARQLNKADDSEKPALKARILAAGNLLGILEQDATEWLQGAGSDDAVSAGEIEALIQEREEAKQAKDYGRADQIREDLLEQGVVLEDSREGTRWKRT
jgi:cysteinyl-tRNA synthetase